MLHDDKSFFERLDYDVAISGIETVINGFRRYENS